MELIKSQSSSNGTGRIDTYYDKEVGLYGENVERQRLIAIAGGYVDSQDHYYPGVKEIFLIKSIIDNSKKGMDCTEITREIMFNPEHEEYLAQWFKGRGSFIAHYPLLLKMVESMSAEVAKLTGYSIHREGPSWTLGRGE